MDDTASVMQNLSQYTLANTKHIWKTRLVVNLSKSGLERGSWLILGRFEKVTHCDLLCQVASSVGGVEDLVIEY